MHLASERLPSIAFEVVVEVDVVTFTIDTVTRPEGSGSVACPGP